MVSDYSLSFACHFLFSLSLPSPFPPCFAQSTLSLNPLTLPPSLSRPLFQPALPTTLLLFSRQHRYLPLFVPHLTELHPPSPSIFPSFLCSFSLHHHLSSVHHPFTQIFASPTISLPPQSLILTPIPLPPLILNSSLIPCPPLIRYPHSHPHPTPPLLSPPFNFHSLPHPNPSASPFHPTSLSAKPRRLSLPSYNSTTYPFPSSPPPSPATPIPLIPDQQQVRE